MSGHSVSQTVGIDPRIKRRANSKLAPRRFDAFQASRVKLNYMIAFARNRIVRRKHGQIASVSAMLNKHLKHAIKLEDKQSLYSVRHWMADRLRQIGASELQAKYILGHSRASQHDRYGSEHLDLATLRQLLQKARLRVKSERDQLDVLKLRARIKSNRIH